MEHVENVVVGSGFGGSVAAYRLADADREVMLLERGKSYGPGDFPRDPWEMSGNFWDPSEGHAGLFDVWSFRRLDAVVSSGLGGGSLIYANVLLRKPEDWFGEQNKNGAFESWPVSRCDLDPHYDVVETMLQGQRFPAGQPGFEGVRKAAAMEAAAAGLRRPHEFEFPNLAVSFAPRPGAVPAVGVPWDSSAVDYENLHGKERRTCTLCGQCDIGCNVGAKNTLDHTYLSAAKDRGAEIRTLCEVKMIRPDGGKYIVTYLVRNPESVTEATTVQLSCDRLILAAGTFGTTYLLLRARREGTLPALSKALGTRFCSNGDFIMNVPDTRLDGVPHLLYASSGPVITSAVKIPQRNEGGSIDRGFFIEDSGYPALLDWALEAGGDVGRATRFGLQRFWSNLTRNPRSNLGPGLATLFGTGVHAASTMPLLGMGRDVPDGRMTLKKGKYLANNWTPRTSQRYFADLEIAMQEVAEQLGGRAKAFFNWRYLYRTISVHPLGGAPMGHSQATGVCNGFGAVYGYPNLFIADGSAMPGAVGANPSLTIAAFSDRMVDQILAAPGLEP